MEQLFNQATQLHQAGKLEQAAKLYQQLLAQSPQHPVLNARMAKLLVQAGQARASLAFFDRAVPSLAQDEAFVLEAFDAAALAANTELGRKWLELGLGQHEQSLKLLEKLAGAELEAHREKAALKLVDRILKLDGQNANAMNLKGMILSRLGDIDKGYKLFQRALRLNPGQIGVVRNLILHGKGRKEPLLEQVIPQFEQQLRSPQLPAPAKLNIAFILHMHYEKTDPETAFTYLKLGNDLSAQLVPYDHGETEQMFDRLEHALGERLKSAATNEFNDSDRAIFVLGMPRSGTTLVEQVLGSHSSVTALGELEFLRQRFEEFAGGLLEQTDDSCLAESAANAVNAYLEDVTRGYPELGPKFVDKMPYNFMLAGLICAAMPKATVIHCVRSPIETCYSIYKQNFSGSHSYTNKMNDLGAYYKRYVAMMEHWKTIYPNQIHDIHYEDLVRKPEETARSLLAHCVLDFEPKCLAFYKNKGAVRTASVAQVRRPIYKDSLKASERLKTQLAPLIDALS